MVQVVPIQSFGLEQNCSSKHLDRSSTGPGSEQICRLNSLYVVYYFFKVQKNTGVDTSKSALNLQKKST